MSFEQRGLIAADHPGLAGHFLATRSCRGSCCWTRCCGRSRPGGRPTGRWASTGEVSGAAAPEQPFTIRLKESGGDEVRFDCLGEDGRLLARGHLTLAGDGAGRDRRRCG